MTSEETWEGKRINQYDVQQYLARGGMADIYRAYDTLLKRTVCLKVLQADLLDDVAFVKRFKREAQTAARLDHPDIIKIFDIGETSIGQPYLVMEFVEAGSLDKLAQEGDVAWPLPVVSALRLVKRLAVALTVAHQRHIYHRDLKPQNILMRYKTEPVLTDFGVAAVAEGTKLTQQGEIPGTPFYMSPEQIRGEAVDGRSDIYAVGLILYEILAGSHPYAHTDPWRILDYQATIEPPPLRLGRDGLSEATYRVVNTCLHKHPANRYQTTLDLMAALDEALRAESGETVVPNPQQQLVLFMRQNWLLLLLILLILTLLIVVLVGLFSGENQKSSGITLTNTAVYIAMTLPTSATAEADITLTPTPLLVIDEARPTLIPVTPTPSMTSPPPTAPPPTETAVLPPTSAPPTALQSIHPQPTHCTIDADNEWRSFFSQYASRLKCGTSDLFALLFEKNAYQLYYILLNDQAQWTAVAR